MNKFIGIGRICNEPEISYTQSGSAVAKYRIAINRDFKKDGKQEADFLNCVTFGKNADFVKNYLRKGMKIAVEGRIQTSSYDNDGVRHYKTDIIVDRHEFCESRNSGTDQYEREERQAIQTETDSGFTAVSGEDLPF